MIKRYKVVRFGQKIAIFDNHVNTIIDGRYSVHHKSDLEEICAFLNEEEILYTEELFKYLES